MLWLILRYHPNTCFEDVRKTTKEAQDHQFSDQYSKPKYPRSNTTIFSIYSFWSSISYMY
jgi:hypothetical protein